MSAVVEARIPASSLTITIEHHGPLELLTLTNSLQAVASSFARYADRTGVAIQGDDVRLYIKEIRSGSVVVELVALAKTIPMVIEQAKSILDFARFLWDTVRYFRGEEDGPPEGMIAKDANDLRTLVAPVAADPRATLQIQASEGATVTVNLTMTSNEANAVQNRTQQYVASQAAPVSGIQKDRLFYFYQARDQRSAKAGDQGIIEAIATRPVKTLVASDALKQQMLGEALFTKAYVVDVDVQTINGKPSLYRILDVKESIDRDA
jgi:hypothetical protein